MYSKAVQLLRNVSVMLHHPSPNQLSDHLPCFTLLETDNIVNNSKPKFTRIFKQNDDAIQQIKNEINSSELYKQLDTSQTADPNVSYNVMMEVIEAARKKT